MVKLSMKSMFRISSVAFFVLVIAGCGDGERSVETDTPRSYSKAGIKFEYPGNWEVTEDGQQAGLRYLIVESPGDAILTIQIYPADDALTIQEYAKNFARLSKEGTLFFVSVSTSTFTSANRSNGYEVLIEHFSDSVFKFLIETPYTRTYRRKPIGSKVCFIITQEPNVYHSNVNKGFEQIFLSFVYETP